MVLTVDKCKENGPGSDKWRENNACAELLMGPERSAADPSKTQRN